MIKPFLTSVVIVALAAFLGVTVMAQTGSAYNNNPDSCGPNNIRCMDGYTAMCAYGNWTCQPNGGALPYCVARCPDGYQYRTCTEDGHPINYFADPCLTHYSSSSSSSSSSSAQSCGPNPYLCRVGTYPQCVDGQWRCVWSSGHSSSSVSSLHLTSLSPSSGSARTQITIEGTGFRRNNNVVMFGNKTITAGSWDGTHLTFRIPAVHRWSWQCVFRRGGCRETGGYRAGNYPVSVRANGVTSNVLTFTIQ